MPHYDRANIYQMITYRLTDALPKNVAGTMEFQIKLTGKEKTERRKHIKKLLDADYGNCLLKQAENAVKVVDSWQFFDKQRYDLIAYVVMPNHVHVLIKTYDGWPLSKVIHSWKSYTAKEILKKASGTLALPNCLWQREYWDRFIRDDAHFIQAIKYIHNNPVKAGLCDSASDWHWSRRLSENRNRSEGKPF